jgi:hypothetical protein
MKEKLINEKLTFRVLKVEIETTYSSHIQRRVGGPFFWLLVLDSTDSKHKLEVTRLGQVPVQNRFQKMNMKK